MTKQLEKTWAGKVLTPEELKQYANFEADLKTRFTVDEKKAFEKNWSKLVSQIEFHLERDPKSEFGTNIAKQVMDLINGLYGKEHANLRHSIWQKGFKKGQMDIAPEIVQWLDKAMDTYYRGRIYSLLDQVEGNPSPDLPNKWNSLMDEMYGDSQSLKQEVIDAAQVDERVSQVARKWLQQFSKP